MTDLIRPALYSAEHLVVPVEESGEPERLQSVVGPVCESGDFLAKDVALPPCHNGNLLAVMDTGAYGASMASNYNMRGRALEVLVEGATTTVIARREQFTDLMARFRVKEEVNKEQHNA